MKPGGEGFDLVVADGVPVRVWPPRHGQHVAQAFHDNNTLRPASAVVAHRDRAVAVSLAVEDAREFSLALSSRSR